MSAHRRTAARTAAVQALFQTELAGTGTSQVIDEFLKHRVTDRRKMDRKWFRSLVEGVRGSREELDPRIGCRLSQGWSIERIDTTLLCLLRCALWELSLSEGPPARAVISDYMRISEGFVDERETAFVNAVLDALARECRQAEFA